MRTKFLNLRGAFYICIKTEFIIKRMILMSWIYRVHLITSRKISGINERLDRLISLQLHYHGKLEINDHVETIYCYTAEYDPQLNFISNDYREMDTVQQTISWFSVENKMSSATISAMGKIFRHILLQSDHFYVFFTYLYADANIEDGKMFFEIMLKNKMIFEFNANDAQNLFIKLLDFTNRLDGRTFYASENDKTIFDYQMIYPCTILNNKEQLPCINEVINIHNILFQVKKE